MGFWNGVQDIAINALDDGLTNGMKAMSERMAQRNKAGKMPSENNDSSLVSGAIFASAVVAKFLINKYKKEKI